jgi:hypothetical protein
MASTVKTHRRASRSSVLVTTRDLPRFVIAMTGSAREVLRDEASVRAKVREMLPEKAGEVPDELVLWRGIGADRVVAFVNKHVRTIYVDRFGAAGSDSTREAAVRSVSLGIGTRPDLPSGRAYVRRVRGIWKGLLPRGHP